MTKAISVKKSVSMPQSLWRFVDKHSKESGHGMASRTIQKALELLQKREAKK
jgi:Arc/MetJ-type ribon-helix-helix transcriptional regulator